MKAKLRVWLWWLAVAATLLLAIREVGWLGDRLAEHRARRQATVVAKPADSAQAQPWTKRGHFPVPISGFGPL